VLGRTFAEFDARRPRRWPVIILGYEFLAAAVQRGSEDHRQDDFAISRQENASPP